MDDEPLPFEPLEPPLPNDPAGPGGVKPLPEPEEPRPAPLD
jgi:hypothetical protein